MLTTQRLLVCREMHAMMSACPGCSQTHARQALASPSPPALVHTQHHPSPLCKPPAQTFNKALNKASKVFTIGEYYKTKPYDQVAAWIGDRLNSSALDSSLGIPMMFAMREVFVWKSAGMHLLRDVREHWRSNFRNKMPVRGKLLLADVNAVLCCVGCGLAAVSVVTIAK